MFALKVVIGFLLIVESLQTEISESDEQVRIGDFERMKVTDHFDNKDYYVKHYKNEYPEKKINQYSDQNYKGHKKQKYYKDEKQNHLGNDKYYENKNENKKHNRYAESDNRPSGDYMRVNEIDSNDFKKTKYESYGKHSKHPNHFEGSAKHSGSHYHEKPEQQFEKHHEYKKHKESHSQHQSHQQHRDQPIKKAYDLSHDTKVNSIDSHRHIAPDTEFIDTRKVGRPEQNEEHLQRNYQNLNEPYIKRVKKDFYQDLKIVDLSNPPPKNNSVLMARYIIHNVDWAALATMSSRSPLKNAPFANIISISDGPKNKGIGVPFFYITPFDLSSEDLNKDNRCSITVTLAETDYCQKDGLDPQDPRCARLILSGKMKRIKAGTTEEEFAKSALFSRHPEMKTWPADHEFFFSKLKIGQIIMLDHFGGPSYVDVQEYLNAENPTEKK